jgi:hypothetical protein
VSVDILNSLGFIKCWNSVFFCNNPVFWNQL